MIPIELILSKLPDATKNAHGWNAKCPAHDDSNPSLAISEGDDGRVLIHCFVGCDTAEVVSAMGLKMSDLMPSGNGHSRPSSNDRPKRSTKPQTIYADAQQAIASLEQTKGPHSAKLGVSQRTGRGCWRSRSMGLARRFKNYQARQ